MMSLVVSLFLSVGLAGCDDDTTSGSETDDMSTTTDADTSDATTCGTTSATCGDDPTAAGVTYGGPAPGSMGTDDWNTTSDSETDSQGQTDSDDPGSDTDPDPKTTDTDTDTYPEYVTENPKERD